MGRSKQPPNDRPIGTGILDRKAEWTELRKRTKLTGAELEAVLSELAREGFRSYSGGCRNKIRPLSSSSRGEEINSGMKDVMG